MSSDGYLHGLRLLKIDKGPRPVRTVESAVIGLVGTAPKGPVNTPVLIAGSTTEAVQTFSADWDFSIPAAIDQIFDEATGFIIAINVLDPDVHVTAEPAAAHTKNDGVFSLAHGWVRNVVVKTSLAGLPCNEGKDYTLNADKGVVTPTRQGLLADRSSAWIGYDYLDASKVTDADVIGGVDAVTGAYTGAWALVAAQAKLRITPRILIAPGYTHQRIDGGVAGVTIVNGGGSYSRPKVVITGDGTGAQATAKMLGGEIVDIDIVKPGGGYTTATVTVTDESGAGASANLTVTAGAVSAATITATGANYTAPDVIVSGDGTGAVLEAVVRDGMVMGLLVVNGGTGYTTATVAISEPADGAGAVCVGLVGKVRNAVTTELAVIAERIGAVVYKDGPGGADADVLADRSDWDNPRIEIVEGRVLRLNPNNNNIEAFWQSATKAGRRIATDNDFGWWWSDSNKPIAGIVGVEKAVDYVYGQSACQANFLNSQSISVIVYDDGYRTWGSRSTSSDLRWSLTKRVRTYDILMLSLQRALRWAIDRNVTKTFISQVEETANQYFREYIQLGALVNARCYADPELNIPMVLEKGRVYFNIAWCDTPQAEEIVLRTYLETDYLTELFK